MILPVLQIVAIAAVAFYLCRWRRNVHRRNAQTWESLLSELRPDWSARELSDRFLWQEGVNTSPEAAWEHMEGPKGLWVMFKNAGVMMEMADYAAKHCHGDEHFYASGIGKRPPLQSPRFVAPVKSCEPLKLRRSWAIPTEGALPPDFLILTSI